MHDSTAWHLQEGHFKYNNIGKLKIKGWMEDHRENISQKKADMIILISDKVNFRATRITRDRRRHYIIDKTVNPPKKT